MDYWKWLGKGLRYIFLFGWTKSPFVEGVFGGGILGAGAGIIAVKFGGYWWIMPAIAAFLIFTHGMYRDIGKHNKEEA